LDDIVLGAKIEKIAFPRNPFPVEDVHFHFTERRRYLIFHNLDFCPVSDNRVAILDRSGPAYFRSYGCVKLQRTAAGSGFGVTEHNTDLFANLVDENETSIGTGDDSRQLTKRLGHHARLQSHVAIA